MNPSSGNPGLTKLAGTIQGQIQKNQDANSALPLDFGEIQADGSLLTNTYPIPIPKGDYTVCRHLTLGAIDGRLTETTEGDMVKIPEKMRSPGAGDRVLVAWVQSDAVVIDIIASASSL